MLELNLLFMLVGLSFGSFLASCAYRMPKEIPIFAPRSFCPSCRSSIPWYLLVPVAGFVLARGKCSHCSTRISWSYPVIELLSAFVVLVFSLKQGLTASFLLSLVFSLTMLLVIIVDWKDLVIPNRVLIVGFIGASATKVLLSPSALIHDFETAGLALGSMLVVRAVGNAAMRKESMGWGDVKLSALLGFVLGFWNFLLTLWLAALCGLLFALVVLPQSERRHSKIPFGAFLAATSIVVLYFQNDIVEVLVQWLTFNQ